MAKISKHKKYIQLENSTPKLEEPMITYQSVMKIPSVEEFTYKKFQKIANKVPFTQKEWASILHLSERTLQRYAKGNSSFEGIYVDRILQIEQLINLGLETFKTAQDLYNWLKKDKYVFGQLLNFSSLESTHGIIEVTNEIGRILHGVYI